MTSVEIDRIVVEDRHRSDLGDLGPLAESIESNGLMHPIVVTPDLRLVAGQRRLEACRKLGLSEVPATVVDGLDDAAALLVAERDENTCRKDMTASEVYGLGKSLEALERPRARERMSEGGKGGVGGAHLAGRTYEHVAPAVGMSAPQWKRLKHIGDRDAEGDEQATETMQKIDRGEETIAGGYRKLRAKDITESPDPDAPKRSYGKVEDRTAAISNLSESGHRASQIADKLGVSTQYVRKLAREHSITLPDAALGKTRALNPHRIVSETVTSLEGAAMSLDLVDDLDFVTPEEADEWATSLSRSLRSLNRLRNQLKEMAHAKG